MSRQRLGQHFLADLHWREEIARAIRVSPHSTVPLVSDGQHCWIEVGAGHGEMTEHLTATGDPVHAIEFDPPLAAGLKRLAKNLPNLDVIHADVLKTDLAEIATGRRIRLYGNLPYYITSPILQHFFEYADLIDEIHIVIQTEVALRLAARPGSRDYGYLSVLTQLYARPEFVFEIPRAAFNPPPEVTSALVTLRLPGERSKLFPENTAPGTDTRESRTTEVREILSESQVTKTHESTTAEKHEIRAAKKRNFRDAETHFLNFVKLCFSQKRKTLVNNLRSAAEPDAIRAALESLGLRPDARAEQLSVTQFAALFAQVKNHDLRTDRKNGERA